MDTPIDHIEESLDMWKHTTWGFVIYRCTYASDDDFASLIAKLKSRLSENLEFYGGAIRPMAQQIDWKVIEDPVRLKGATTAEVRKLFDEWCRSPEAVAEQPNATIPVAESFTARYRFCVQVDQAALDSFINYVKRPWVNVILRDWPYWPDTDDEDEDNEEEDGDEYCQFSPIEGSQYEDVGWCKVGIDGVFTEAYASLCHANAWYTTYQRPPIVV